LELLDISRELKKNGEEEKEEGEREEEEAFESFRLMRIKWASDHQISFEKILLLMDLIFSTI